jgi:hypothetical protein
MGMILKNYIGKKMQRNDEIICKTMVQNFKKCEEQYFEFLWEST